MTLTDRKLTVRVPIKRTRFESEDVTLVKHDVMNVHWGRGGKGSRINFSTVGHYLFVDILSFTKWVRMTGLLLVRVYDC